MEFFKIYFKSRVKFLIILLVFLLVFITSFLLYHLEFAALVYPFLISFVFLILFLNIDYNREKKKFKNLKILKNLEDITISDINALSDNRIFSEALINICNQKNELDNKAQKKYRDMIEYYTLWVHQIKTPIASMKLNLQNEDTPLSHQLQSDLFRIEQYVQMVLTYLRLDSDTTDYHFKKYELDEIIKSSVKKFAGSFIGKKISLDYNELDMTVLTDKKWLSFVLEQILSNSLKYTDENGCISIYKENNYLCIKDTGIGIAFEDLPRIFEKGYTGINGRKDKASSGIGLYLCKRICDSLGVNIIVSSETGKGTTVKLDLSVKKIELE